MTTFTERTGARWYSICVTRKDAVKVEPKNYFPGDLPIINGIVQYKLSIGGLRFGLFTDEASMLEEKAR